MDRKSFKRNLFLLSGLLFSSISFADAAVQYYELTFPQSAGLVYPVFVYQQTSTGWKQVGYVPDQNTTLFVGPLDITQPQTFQYASGTVASGTGPNTAINWVGSCKFTVTGATISNPSPAPGCGGPGVAIFSVSTADAGQGSNYYSIQFAAGAFPAITTPDKPTAYAVPDYTQNRTVTLYNNTSHAEIQVYYYAGANGGNASLINTQIIDQNTSQSYTFPATAFANSLAWAIAGYSDTPGCVPPPIHQSTPAPTCNWVFSGGYAPYDTITQRGDYTGYIYGAYATKIEGTYPAATTTAQGIPYIPNANLDLSAVDGFTFKAVWAPNEKAFCTKAPPNLWSNVNAPGYVGQFSPAAVMASIPSATAPAVNGHTGYDISLNDICTNLSALPLTDVNTGYIPATAGGTGLSAIDANSQYQGCISPCKYAGYASTGPVATPPLSTNFNAAFSASGGVVNAFCCTSGSAYDTKDSCNDVTTLDSNPVGFVDTSGYVKTLNEVEPPYKQMNQTGSELFLNTYSWQFDDTNANMGCPGDTNYSAYIFDGNTPNMNFLTKATDIEVDNLKGNTATVVWKTPEDSINNPTIHYTVNVVTFGGSFPTYPAHSTIYCTSQNGNSCLLSGLTLTTAYQLQVVANDGTRTSVSKTYNFTTTNQSSGNINPPTNVAAVAGTQPETEENISWHAATDPLGSAQFSYTINVTPALSTPPPATTSLAQTLTGLTPNTQYSITVTAQETSGPDVGGVATSTPAVLFTTTPETCSLPAFNTPYATPTTTTEVMSWSTTPGSCSLPNPVNYTIKLNNTAYASSLTGTSKTLGQSPLTALLPGTVYTPTIQVCDATTGVCSAFSTSTESFTTPPENIGVPGSFQQTAHTPSSISFSWAASTDNVPSPALHYQISLDNGTSWNPANPSSGPTGTTYTITGLPENTAYSQVRIRAFNANTNNYSANSNPINASTSAEIITAPILSQIGPNSVTNSSVILNWSSATNDAGNPMDYSYIIPSTGTPVFAGETINTFTVNNLSPQTAYTVAIKACDHINTTVCATSNPEPFTTLEAVPVISPFTLSFSRRWWAPSYASMTVKWSPLVTCTGDPAKGCDGKHFLPASAFKVTATDTKGVVYYPMPNTVKNGSAYFQSGISRYNTYTVKVKVLYDGGSRTVTGTSSVSPP
jgi:hypothetical protein